MEKQAELQPIGNETPTEFAHRMGQIVALNKPPQIKREYGQYFTPIEIAHFMATFLNTEFAPSVIRILDPGTGTGILSTRT